MGLQVAVAAPFRGRGTERLPESEFVVALSLDRDWFSPDQAKRLVDMAVGQGLLAREDGDLVVEFEPDSVEIPDDFEPDESLLTRQSAFEQVLDAAVAAGTDKREAVAAINERQADLGVTVEAAAAVYAREHGFDAEEVARKARTELVDGDDQSASTVAEREA